MKKLITIILITLTASGCASFNKPAPCSHGFDTFKLFGNGCGEARPVNRNHWSS